jgi:hypothetical protein
MFGHHPEFQALLTTDAFQLAVTRAQRQDDPAFHKHLSILDETHEVQLASLDRSTSFVPDYYVDGSDLHTHHQSRHQALRGSLTAIRTVSESARTAFQAARESHHS